MSKGATYTDSGVDHGFMDLFKVKAQEAAATTSQNAERLGIRAMEDTRGESVMLFDNGDHFIGHVSEGLGTKNRIAEIWETEVPKAESQFAAIMQDNYAMMANDCVTLGAIPFSVTMQLDVGNKRWMQEKRMEQIIAGWKASCDVSGCVWGGGETATLRDIVNADSAVLSGSAVGKTIGRTRFSADTVQPGDIMIGWESSGVHANGITGLRDVATDKSKLRSGYHTYVPELRCTFGEALLRPTHIYTYAVETLIRAGIEIHYTANITGHGWRKIMRPRQDLTYVVETLPTPNPLFNVIQRLTGMTRRDTYNDYNRGLGFVLYVPPHAVEALLNLARQQNWPFRTFILGYVTAGPKRVIIKPERFDAFEGEEMKLRI